LRYEVDRRLGAISLNHDDYDQAERLLTSAVEHCDTLLAADDPETVGLLGNLAILHWERRRDLDADAAFDRVLRYEPDDYAPERRTTADVLRQLGMACVVRDWYAWPERLLSRGLELLDDDNDPDGELRVPLWLGLAQTRFVLTEYRATREAVGEAVALLGDGDLDETVAFLQGYDALLDCRWADAEQHMRRKVELSRLSEEDENEAVAIGLGSLADLHRAQGRFAEAMELSERAVRMREACIGDDHPRLAHDMVRHGMIAVQLGDHDAADAHLARGVDLAHRLNRRANAALGVLHLIRGILEWERERFASAEAALREARSIAEDVYGKGHRLTMDSIMVLASVQAEQGRLAEAVPLLEESLSICERHGESSPLDRVDLHTTASRVRLAEGNLADAERHLDAATRLVDERLNREHHAFAAVLFESSRLDRRTGRLREAERKLRDALAVQQRVRLPNHPVLARVRRELAGVLRETGRGEEG
jgi:tetratricopeptide (TPR) repeat protein